MLGSYMMKPFTDINKKIDEEKNDPKPKKKRQRKARGNK